MIALMNIRGGGGGVFPKSYDNLKRVAPSIKQDKLLIG